MEGVLFSSNTGALHLELQHFMSSSELKTRETLEARSHLQCIVYSKNFNFVDEYSIVRHHYTSLLFESERQIKERVVFKHPQSLFIHVLRALLAHPQLTSYPSGLETVFMSPNRSLRTKNKDKTLANRKKQRHGEEVN